MVTQSAVRVMYFLPIELRPLLKSLIVVARTRGVATKLSSMSRSIPSRLQVETALTVELTKFWRCASVSKALVQLLFGPPMESSTLLPVFLQFVTCNLGQLSASTTKAPFVAMMAQARRTVLERQLTSSLNDSPQQEPPNPQKEMSMIVGTALPRQIRASNRQITVIGLINRIKIKSMDYLAVQTTL